MKRSVRTALGASAVIASSMSTAPAFAQLQPSGEWTYREDAESCRVYRAFGTGKDRILLQLRTFGPGSAVEAMLVGNSLPNEPGALRLVEVGWDGDWRDLKQIGLVGSIGGSPTLMMLISHRPVGAFLEGFIERTMILVNSVDPAAETIQVRVVGGAPITLQAGSLQQPLEGLVECEAALMQKWGWSADYDSRIATPPEMRNAESFYSVIVYPAAQLINRVGSLLQLRLKIGVDGKVTDCVVQSSPNSTMFGSDSCRRIQKVVRYTPAADAQGQPVESHVQLSITFARYD